MPLAAILIPEVMRLWNKISSGVFLGELEMLVDAHEVYLEAWGCGASSLIWPWVWILPGSWTVVFFPWWQDSISWVLSSAELPLPFQKWNYALRYILRREMYMRCRHFTVCGKQRFEKRKKNVFQSIFIPFLTSSDINFNIETKV